MTKQTQTTLQVEGMSCPSCVRHIDEAIRALGGVSKVDVRLRDGTVVVTHEPRITVERLVLLFGGAGYAARLVDVAA